VRESTQGAQVVTTPELSLTGYTCEDLFHSEALLRDTELGIQKLIEGSKHHSGIWVIGAPLRVQDGRLFNGAFVISSGRLLGFCPKIFLPNMGEFYERRWFVTGRTLHEEVRHHVFGSFFASLLYSSLSSLMYPEEEEETTANSYSMSCLINCFRCLLV
jgi:predicted amidohydrolase